MLLIFFFKCHQHYYIQDMSTTKGKEKNNSVKGTWVIELSQAIELKQNQKFETWRTETKPDTERTRMRSRDLFGPQERRSFRPSCQNQKDTRIIRDAFLHLISKDAREPRGKMVNLKKVDSKNVDLLSSTSF